MAARRRRRDAETAARAATMLKASFNARGQAGLDRLDQDETQKLCSEYANRPLPASVAEKIQQVNLATIRYPADGKLVGDWKNGEKIAQSGQGIPVLRRSEGSGGRQLLRVSPAGAAGAVVRHDRPVAVSIRQAARLHRRDAQVRVGQGVQRRCVRRVLEHAALRPQPHPDRAADPRRRRAAGRPGVAGQQVTAGDGRRGARRRSPAARDERRDETSRIPAGARRGIGRRAADRRGARGRATPTASASTAALEPFGNVALLHITDCHAQLHADALSRAERQPRRGRRARQAAALVGEALLRHFGIAPGTRDAHAFTYLDFERAARAYGAMGGFAHLATLIKRLRGERKGALLLDGGDTWQGSATSLWTRGQDMVDAAKLLGVDVMTGSLGIHVRRRSASSEVVDRDFAGRIDFIAQNVRTADFGDPVFAPYVIKRINGVARRHRGTGVSVHADRQSALLRSRVDVRHPGRGAAEGASTTHARRARRSSCCCRTTAWMSTSSSRRASPESMRSSADIRTTAFRSRRSSRMRAARRSSRTPAATASSSACSSST